MAYNPALYYPQGYQMPYPAYQPQQQIQMQPAQPQPQTRVIEVVPVDSEEAAASFPVAMGATQVMFAKDDSAIYVKSVSVTGASEFNVFTKRPKPAKKESFDLSDYVTKEELNERLRALETPTDEPEEESKKK